MTPTYKGVRIYEELSRVLSGRIDFNELIDRVSRSMNYRIYTDILNVLGGLGEADLGAEYINATGTYTEQELLELIDHVEADTGLPAIVYGTRNALSKVTIDAVAAGAEAAKTDKYTGWHYGTFHGAPMVSFPNAHKPGTSEFVLNNDRIYVYAGGEKPIKFVNEGDAIIIPGNPQDNADLTQEFLYMEKYGVGAAVVDKMGVYDIA